MTTSTAVDALRSAYHAQASAATWDVDERVVGVIGVDVPDELLFAAGLVPWRLRGAPGEPTPIADHYLEGAIDPAARSIAERILSGTYAGLSRLVLCHDSEASVRLFYYLRELRRIEPGLGLPELAFVDVLHQPTRTSTAYTIGRLTAFRDRLAEWTGVDLDDAAVHEAIAGCNERRRALHDVAWERRRRPPRLSGVDALAVIGAGMSMSLEAYVPLARAVSVEAAGGDESSPGVRLFVTGTAHDHTGIYAAIESCGAMIVGENHERGELWAQTLVDEAADPMRALAMRYQYGAPASTGYSIDRRAGHTVDAARAAGADAVVSVLRRGDNAPYWDVPEQRRRLAEADLPMMVIDLDTYRPDLTDEQAEAVRTFINRVGTAAASASRGQAVSA